MRNKNQLEIEWGDEPSPFDGGVAITVQSVERKKVRLAELMRKLLQAGDSPVTQKPTTVLQ